MAVAPDHAVPAPDADSHDEFNHIADRIHRIHDRVDEQCPAAPPTPGPK